MEKLKEALIQFAHSNPSLFPNDSGNSYPVLIEQSFRQFFTDFQTPNHPPYAAMIYKAIWELNKKGGSSEKSISKYIKKEYAELPWAHSTLLKHHLGKLCDRKEICMTDKQCYLLAGAEPESEKKSSGPSKKHKKHKSRPASEAGKKSGRPHKKCKKKEKDRSGVQETGDNEQLGSCKRKSSKQNNKVTVDESHEQKQTVEVKMGDIQIQEQNGLHKRKRKHGLKPKRKSSKRVKKHAINEDANLKQNDEVTGAESHEQKQMVEVDRGDLLVQEQNEAGQESDHEEQIQTKKNPEILQAEESPDSNPMLHGNGKRVRTRSQLKTVANKNVSAACSGYADMPKDKPDIVEHLSNDEQQGMEVIKVNSTVDTEPQKISRSPRKDEPLIELLKPMPSKMVAQDCGDEPPEKSPPVVDKPKYKRRGRPRKLTGPEKGEGLCNSKAAVITRKSQKSIKKGKVGNKKGQAKYKHHGRHKMTRRSSSVLR